jgi:hypothetical protein
MVSLYTDYSGITKGKISQGKITKRKITKRWITLGTIIQDKNTLGSNNQ